MKLILIVEQLVIGCTTAYFWFNSSDNVFKLFKERKSESNYFFWPYIVGFIAFPYVVAFCYKTAWDFLENEQVKGAVYLSIIPLIFFLLGGYLYKMVNR